MKRCLFGLKITVPILSTLVLRYRVRLSIILSVSYLLHVYQLIQVATYVLLTFDDESCYFSLGQTIMMSASILMTVAIAIERYIAVHYPLDYNQVKINLKECV